MAVKVDTRLAFSPAAFFTNYLFPAGPGLRANNPRPYARAFVESRGCYPDIGDRRWGLQFRFKFNINLFALL